MSAIDLAKYETKKVGTSWLVDGRDIGRKRGQMYDATIIEYVRSGEAKINVTGKVKDMTGREVSQTWTATVEVYKLKKPLLKDEV